MLKKFFSFKLVSNLARLVLGFLVLATLIRAVFSPTSFDQGLNLILLILVLVTSSLFWQFLKWSARQQTKM
ncbi:MAG: hypothetical protein AAB900_01400, partial [Patescibacteria group bacterium]